MRRGFERAALAIAVLLAVASTVQAYPQFQLSQAGGETCGRCHISPAGGGLLDDMGRFVAEDTAATEGDAAFLHGAIELPSWLAVGGNVRGALGGRDGGFGAGFATVPMQAEVLVGARRGPVIGVVSLGFPGISREHYVMYRPQTDGVYARLGRFQPVYGLRLAEHALYTRRYGGSPLGGEAYGASVGYVSEKLDAHVTGFVRDPLAGDVPLHSSVEFGSGGSAYVEARVRSNVAVGVQGRAAWADLDSRWHGGITGKLWLSGPQLLFQAEGSLIRHRVNAGDVRRIGAVGTAVVTRFFPKAIAADLALGHYSPDVSFAKSALDALDLNVRWRWTPHIEFYWMNRVATVGLGDGGATSWWSLVQAHYRL